MSKKSIKTVLLVEDNPGDARLLREMLQEEGLYSSELLHADSMADAEKFLAEHAVDIILLDLGLPDAQGLEAVRRAHAVAPRVPLVVLTGLDDEVLAAQTLQEGARLPHQGPDNIERGPGRNARNSASPALCRRAQEYGRRAVHGNGARTGYAQFYRRSRYLHRRRRKSHLP